MGQEFGRGLKKNLADSILREYRGKDVVSCIVDLKNKTNQTVRDFAESLNYTITAGIKVSKIPLWCSSISVLGATNKFVREHLDFDPYAYHAEMLDSSIGTSGLLVLITNRLIPVLWKKLDSLRKSKELFIVYLNDDDCKREIEAALSSALQGAKIKYTSYEVNKRGFFALASSHKESAEKVLGKTSRYIILFSRSERLVEVQCLLDKTQASAIKEFEIFCDKNRPDWARLITSDGEVCLCKYRYQGTFVRLGKEN